MVSLQRPSIVGAVGGIGTYNMNTMNKNSEKITEKNLMEVEALSGINSSLISNKANISELINEDNREDLNNLLSAIDANSKVTNDSMKTYAIPLTKEESEGYKRFEARVLDYQTERRKVVEAVKQGDYEKANQLYDTAYKEYRDAVLSSVAKQIEGVNNATSELKAENKAVFSSSRKLMYAIMVIGFLGSLGLGIVLSQHLIRRIRKIKDFSEQLGEGDLTHSISDDGKDELGQMAQALNNAVEHMQGLVSELVIGTQEISSTTEELSATMDEISTNMGSVRETISQNNTGIEELTASTEEISASTPRN